MQRVSIVGTGRLARALARTLGASDEPRFVFHGIHGRSATAAAAIVAACGAGRVLTPAEISASDVVFLAVSDDALATVARALAPDVAEARSQLWLHGSGACGLEVFAALRTERRSFATLHPLVSLPGDSEATLRGCTVVLAGEDAARQTTTALARALGGRPTWVDRLDRDLYHAAASLLANGLTALFASGLDILGRATHGELGVAAARGLMQSALEPLARLAPQVALTGPVRRGDAAVVARHRAALSSTRAELLPLYDALMDHALELARQAGLPKDPADAVRRALSSSPGERR